MKIASVQAYAVKIPRREAEVVGMAGLPVKLRNGSAMLSGRVSAYRFVESNRAIYSANIETLLVRIETDEGTTGWGESQSPVAPEVVGSIIEKLLKPIIIGEDALAPRALWDRMYSAMRVRGLGGGSYLDAISGIDIAVWDLCGKAFGQPVSRLLGGPVRPKQPCYISGLAGARALDILHQDVGRTGITEGRKIASLADAFYVPVAPYIRIGLGPQISAALHLAAVCSNLLVTECNPLAYQVANRFLDEPIDIAASQFRLPEGAGLGVTPNLEVLREFIV